MNESLLEQVVSQLLSTAPDKWQRVSLAAYEDFDFVCEAPNGDKFAIEVMAPPPNERKLATFASRIDQHGDISRFALVTEDAPTKDQLINFNLVFASSDIPALWLGINGLPKLLDIESPGDLSSPKGIADLQMSALLTNRMRYLQAPIGLIPVPPHSGGTKTQPPEKTTHFVTRKTPASQTPLSQEYLALSRQFSFATLTLMQESGSNPDQALRLGDKTKNVTVVLSDLKDFSSLVKVSRPEDLRDTMCKYYTRARQLVWKYGGVLDKFVGDSVLAMFGYPISSSDATVRAIRFARDLVELGSGILTAHAKQMTEVIPTGTRVGIACGDIWPLDIGEHQLEVSFVGNVINLAARLEKNSTVDRVLICNCTFTHAISEDATYLKSLQYTEKLLDPAVVRGQMYPIKCWEIKQ